MGDAPRMVEANLDWPGTWQLARLALVSAYLIGGVTKLVDWPGAVAEQGQFGLHPPALFAALTILVELAASIAIIVRRMDWLAAGALGVFTGLAALIANAFWTMPAGQQRAMGMNAFFEHIGQIGGLVLAALVARRRERV